MGAATNRIIRNEAGPTATTDKGAASGRPTPGGGSKLSVDAAGERGKE